MCCLAMLHEHYLTGHGIDDREVAQIMPEIDEDIMRLLIMDPEVMAKAKKIKEERLAKQLAIQAEKKA